MTASPWYRQLSTFAINKSQLIQDLRDFGADYVVQKGALETTKNPLPGSYYEITKTEKVERKITSITTYYRYTVIPTEYDDLAVVRATYVVNFKPSTGDVIVGSYNYKIIRGNPDGQKSVGGPSLINVKPLNDSTNKELLSILEYGITYTVNDAMQSKKLGDSEYHVEHI